MPAKHRTPAEQAHWDRVFEERYPKCLESHSEKGEQYCLHLAADFADLALSERRRSARADKAHS